MRELNQIELLEINGGGTESTNYIGGLGPAIPESGGAYIAGFFKGFFSALFGK